MKPFMKSNADDAFGHEDALPFEMPQVLFPFPLLLAGSSRELSRITNAIQVPPAPYSPLFPRISNAGRSAGRVIIPSASARRFAVPASPRVRAHDRCWNSDGRMVRARGVDKHALTGKDRHMPRAVYSFISRCLGTADVLRLARFHQTECLPPSR